MSEFDEKCENVLTGYATSAVIGEIYTGSLKTILWDYLKEKLNRAKHERRN